MHSKNRESALKNLSSDLEAAAQKMDVESAVCVWEHCIHKNPKVQWWQFGKGSVPISAGRAGFWILFHGQTVTAMRGPALCERSPTQWGLGSLSVPGRKGLCIPRKEKLLFVSVRAYPKLSLLSLWIKGNGNINLWLKKKKWKGAIWQKFSEAIEMETSVCQKRWKKWY